ncbi:excalibur calcium-binding domain-containing protein [Rhodoluna sp.]|uniref:excalibur calcium-binding domain-containing protein n=1 Tax=Rhodoluna sp. TaxID=1969481 RepID=UPI0025D6B650|nr:excalibur calcium-binding domain-containing protein [Rhodoluna sp.]
MFRKIIGALLAGLIAATPTAAFAAVEDTVVALKDSNGVGIPDVELWVYASALGTDLKIKTDASGVARLPALKGKGSFQINHCKQAASSIALQIYDVNYGDGGQILTIQLPARPKTYEYQIKSSNGLSIQRPEQIGVSATPSAYSWVQDYGTFSTPLGKARISSCGSAWFTNDVLRVAPFASSESEPQVGLPQTITGGTTNRLYPISEFSTTSTKTLIIENFKYIEVSDVSKTVYARQPTRVTGKFLGIASPSDVPLNSFYGVRCLSKSNIGMQAGGMASKVNDDLTLEATVTFETEGTFRCLLGGTSISATNSLGFDVKVLPIKVFASATSKKYKSCAALNKFFDGGLAKSIKAQTSNLTSEYLAAVSAAGYKLNSALDKDKDGVACER